MIKTATLGVCVLSVLLMSKEQEEEFDVGVSTSVALLIRKICRLVQRLESAVTPLRFK